MGQEDVETVKCNGVHECPEGRLLFGLQWAPFVLPMIRRFQTVMALFWIVSSAFGGFISGFIFLYLLFTRFYLLALAYLIWMYYDKDTEKRGGRKIEWFRKLRCWNYLIDYFPVRIVKSCTIPPDRNYMFCVFPHGILSAGAFGNFGPKVSEFEKLYPGLEVFNATLDMHFHTPFFREYLLALGAVSASKESINYVLRNKEPGGKVVVLVVGGAAESLLAHPQSYTIILKERKGFIKIALETGTPLVPVFSFGETDLFDQAPNPPGSKLYRFQNWLRKYIGMAPCLFFGRGIFQYNFGVVPHRRPVTTVVGAPIIVPHRQHPNQEEIEEYHEKFLCSLQQLFDTHKAKYLSYDSKLLII